MSTLLRKRLKQEEALRTEPLIAVLNQLRDLLRSMTDDQYTAKPGGVISSSVGGHVRHCLDHVDSLLAGIDQDEMSYDDRKRDTDVETCRSAALAAIDRQTRALADLAGYSPDGPIRLEILPSRRCGRSRFALCSPAGEIRSPSALAATPNSFRHCRMVCLQFQPWPSLRITRLENTL